jgi:tetratricopeptide (TPR) repeat protein
LGTVKDLVETVQRESPTGVHFSGHGGPGALEFEDDDGARVLVPVSELVSRLRRELPAGRLPAFFYLACCRGNDVGDGAESAAARLHREGVTEVVGYTGPILDHLSTAAEEALYAGLAAGRTTRMAVRDARNALLRAPVEAEGRHREPGTAVTEGCYPFAWSQLVLYHRGPEYPLGTPTTADQLLQAEQALRRTYENLGHGRVLKTGFIGRRRELHRVRRHLLREGRRVLVLQGLGGLGKSTLAFYVPPLLRAGKEDVCILWCAATEMEPDPVVALVGQLLDYCRKRFGAGWEEVVQQVDRGAGDDAVQRFLLFLSVLLQNVPRLVLLLDNLESLLIGPVEVSTARPDERAFADWKSEPLRVLWQELRRLAEEGDKLWVVGSCRYQNDAFADVLPVTPLPDDALFRLTGWFPTLQRLASVTRARLVARLDGHPRAVEYAENLIKHRLVAWRRKYGELRRSQPATAEELEREWSELVGKALPGVRERLWANLLLEAIWDNVLDEPMRRMLFRMTRLRRPWQWGLMAQLGEPERDAATAEATAEALRRTSLLEETELAQTPHYTLHPATAAYVRSRFGDEAVLRQDTHRRVGDYLEREAKTSPWLETTLEGGYHLFHAGAYDRACEMLGWASAWLQERGRVREGLEVLEPFLSEGVQQRMPKALVGRLLGTVGQAYHRLGQVLQAIDCYQQHLAIARDIGDRRGEGTALCNLGLAYALGQPQQAIDCSQETLAIFRDIGDRRGEGATLGNLGLAYAALGQPQRAIDCYQQTLAIARDIGDRHGEGTALGNLGLAYAALGQPQRAIDCYQQHLAIARDIGDRHGEARASWNLGLQLSKLGPERLAEAIALMEVCVRFGQEIGHPDANKDAAHVVELRHRLAYTDAPA